MGMICAYYRVDDQLIDQFIEAPQKADLWIIQYNEMVEQTGEMDRIYDLDRAWDIAQFLLKEADASEEKILSNVIRGARFFKRRQKKINNPRYIKSEEVKKIWTALKNINEEALKSGWNKQKMRDEQVYRHDWLTRKRSWDYIMQHIDTIKKAFYEATTNNEGLICQIEL